MRNDKTKQFVFSPLGKLVTTFRLCVHAVNYLNVRRLPCKYEFLGVKTTSCSSHWERDRHYDRFPDLPALPVMEVGELCLADLAFTG